MTAKQIVTSASLVMALGQAAAFAGTAATDASAGRSTRSADGSAAKRDPSAPDAAPSTSAAAGKSTDGKPAPAGTGTFSVGVGYGPVDRLIATAAATGSLGGGRTLSLRTALSKRHRLLTLQLAAPHFAHTDLDLHVELHDRQLLWPDAKQAALGGSVTLSRPIGAHTRAYLAYRLDKLSFEPDRTAAAHALTPESAIGAPLGTHALLSSLRAGIDYDDVDDPRDPMRGTRAGVWIEAADPILGGDTRMMRGHAWIERHQPIGPFTLHLRLGGSIVTSPDVGGVPLGARLRLDGGDDPFGDELPGYAPGSLGPRDPLTGVPLGGNVKLNGRAALELPLFSRIGLSAEVFAAAGGVLDLERRGPGGVGASAGFGLVWHSPIGPIHAGVAFPIDGAPPAIIFSLGF